MQPCMVIIVPQFSGPAGIMHLAVSLARVPQLIDGPKYLEPDAVQPPDDATERRRIRARGPRLHSLVKLAVQCDDAEQRGRELKRRLDCFDPTQRREPARVLVEGGMSQTEAAIVLRVGKATISRDLAQLEHTVDKLLAD
jgi:hypothetical protein